jgi:hypothetical protein
LPAPQIVKRASCGNGESPPLTTHNLQTSPGVPATRLALLSTPSVSHGSTRSRTGTRTRCSAGATIQDLDHLSPSASCELFPGMCELPFAVRGIPRRDNDAWRATARTRRSGAVVAHVSDMTDQWTAMRMQIEQSLVRLHEMIAEAHALNEALGTKGNATGDFLVAASRHSRRSESTAAALKGRTYAFGQTCAFSL